MVAPSHYRNLEADVVHPRLRSMALDVDNRVPHESAGILRLHDAEIDVRSQNLTGYQNR